MNFKDYKTIISSFSFGKNLPDALLYESPGKPGVYFHHLLCADLDHQGCPWQLYTIKSLPVNR